VKKEKKEWLKAQIGQLAGDLRKSESEVRRLTAENAQMQTAMAQMREHWRPVPLAHEWEPRNYQCALCDEPRDAPRHRVTKT
jgi:hypothetical protein